jgi:tungstate transport system substrate-binding protein
LLADGHADVVISHSPQREADMLRDHGDWWYRKVFFNDFLIAGPPDDPGDVRGAADVLDALHRIQRSKARFVSRGDESGTHERETALWSAAGVSLPAERLIVSGQGMGGTLRVASRLDAYTLTDRGSFEQLAPQLRLVNVYAGDPRLLNTYAVITREGQHPARAFAAWLAHGRGRETLAEAITSGQLRGFQLWPDGRPAERPDDTPH